LFSLYGKIAKEQLMPKNFVFYNPEEHQQIISSLENSKVKAIISATGRNPSLAGGVYPFPLIEDGDFNIPSVYMTEEEGMRLISSIGKQAILKSVSKRIPSNGCNVIGNIVKEASERIVITAHIDAKKGSPGATDNATGVAVLLILAELLKDYSGNKQIEIVALNGEDYYAASGQMNYIKENRGNFNNILLNINIDGAAYKEGKTTFSFFDLSEDFLQKAMKTINGFPNITEGIKWSQGDHSIFLQYGRPAMAISSQWFTENSEGQNITHTSKDNLEIVDFAKVIEIAEVLNVFIREL
jgi:aminopeptidase YwaD